MGKNGERELESDNETKTMSSCEWN